MRSGEPDRIPVYGREADGLKTERREIYGRAIPAIQHRQGHFPFCITNSGDDLPVRPEFWIGIEKIVLVGDHLFDGSCAAIEQVQHAGSVRGFFYRHDLATVSRDIRGKIPGPAGDLCVLARRRIQHPDDAIVPPVPAGIVLIGGIDGLSRCDRRNNCPGRSPGSPNEYPFPEHPGS